MGGVPAVAIQPGQVKAAHPGQPELHQHGHHLHSWQESGFRACAAERCGQAEILSCEHGI